MSARLVFKGYVRYLFFSMFALFVLNKLYLRPDVLENDYPEILQIVILSLPNYCEAVMGTLLLAGIVLQLRQFPDSRAGRFIADHAYTIAVILASIYVISQELKFHNLGGNNVYDPYDLVASIVGLALAYAVLRKFGLLEIDAAAREDQT